MNEHMLYDEQGKPLQKQKERLAAEYKKWLKGKGKESGVEIADSPVNLITFLCDCGFSYTGTDVPIYEKLYKYGCLRPIDKEEWRRMKPSSFVKRGGGYAVGVINYPETMYFSRLLTPVEAYRHGLEYIDTEDWV